MESKIVKILNRIKDNQTEEEIVKIFSKKFKPLNLYRDEDNKNILHLLATESTGISKLYICYKALIKKYPSLLNDLDYDRNTFMHYLIDNYHYDAKFILDMLYLILPHKYDPKIINNCGDTILHSYIKQLSSLQKIDIEIYDVLYYYGYKSIYLDENGETILDIIEQNIKVKNEYYEEFITNFHERTNNIYSKKNKPKEKYDIINKKLEDINKVGYLMNNKEYKSRPTIGRDKEVTTLMITLANKRKNPILVGESGVGKTTILDELVYRIENNEVKDFLNGQKIIEVNATTLVAGTELRGSFEKKVKDLVELCIEEDIILFIDEIHEIYGAGLSKGDETNDMAAMIKYYIDRRNLKVIGTTTKDEYNKYFANDALKRRFELIEIKEPDKNTLKIIVKKVFDDMTSEYNIGNSIINNNIINILVELTSSRKKYDDPINNPDLVISIIDKTYSYAYYNSRDDLILDDLINGIKSCDRIYPSVKERYIKEMKDKCSLNITNEPIKKKVLNFSDYIKNNS